MNSMGSKLVLEGLVIRTRQNQWTKPDQTGENWTSGPGSVILLYHRSMVLIFVGFFKTDQEPVQAG